jgi:hypothetical protein
VAITPGPRGDSVRAFVGVSEYSDLSSAESFHEAIQQAAKEAARVLAEAGEELPQVFEVSRLQVVVGNPNVKIYSAVITQQHGG